MILGTLSPAVFLSGFLSDCHVPGLTLTAGQVGFLFQLKDAGGRVAMNSEADKRARRSTACRSS